MDGAPLTGQKAVASILEGWLPRWQDQLRKTSPPHTWDLEVHELDDITLVHLDKACEQYPASAGKGGDNVNPRSFLLLPRETRLRLLDLLHLWELKPLCFQDCVTLVAVLPKAAGGLTPIGVTIVLLRIWSRIRSDECSRWERAHNEPFF